MKRFLDEARRMIRINSVSANGNEELANYVAALMQDRGLKTQVQHVTHSNEDISKRQFNVIGILGDPLVDRKIRKGLLLNSHLDTVSPGISENWTETGGDPFATTIKDGKIYGLGTADVKLDFLCKLHAVEKFRERKLKNPIYLVGTCGEEMGMFGAKYLIKSLSLNPRYVLVGEATESKVIYAHKSSNIFRVSIGFQLVERDARGFNRRIDLHAFGRSAHSAYPHLGTNSILESVDFLQRAMDEGFEMRFTRVDGGETVNKVPDHAVTQFYLTSHQFEDFKRFFRESVKAAGKERAFRVELGGVGDTGVRFLPDNFFPCLTEVSQFFKNIAIQLQKRKDDSFDPSYSTVNFGRLQQKMGVVELHFDLRLLPEVPSEEMLQEVQKGIQNIAVRYPSLNISVVRERVSPGLSTPVDNELVDICKGALEKIGLEPSTGKMATATAAAQYSLAGYHSVVFGPGKSVGNSHSPNEYNSLEQLEKAVQFYETVIERACL